MLDSGKDSALDLVALVGAPNSGKTTLYNWLTNSKFRTVNYPGATVEYSIGQSSPKLSHQFMAMDTPGIYSLFPKSADEEVALKALTGFHQSGGQQLDQKNNDQKNNDQKSDQVKKVILVVDGTQLQRHLLLAEQLKAANFSILIVVTMHDLLKKNGIQLKREILEQTFQCPVVLFDGVRGQGLSELAEKIRDMPAQRGQSLSPWTDEKIALVHTRLEKLVQQVVGDAKNTYAIYDRTAKIDRVLLHPAFGLVCFLAIMTVMFSSIFWLAAPFMDTVDGFFSILGAQVKGLGLPVLLTDFLADGLIASFSAVFVFVPQIFILFLGIGLLESSGYLARAATLIDKPFSYLGMSGRSFVPILSGFACSVPAMMATRNISSRRDRLITNFIVPLMTCSARLPVYALLLSFLFLGKPAWYAGLALAGLYLGALIIGAIAAGILNKILKKNDRGFFMMELPLYRAPRFKVLLSQTISRTKSYVFKAGPAIFVFSVIIWVGTTFPNYQHEDPVHKLQTSYLGQVGQAIEPVFKPLGVDWRVGAGLISAFAAREVFVSSLAIVMNITDDNEESQQATLLQTMQEAVNSQGEKIFTVSTVLGLIVFFMIALQCMSTFAVAIKEGGSFRFALIQLVGLNAVAYLSAAILVQGLRAIGVA